MRYPIVAHKSAVASAIFALKVQFWKPSQDHKRDVAGVAVGWFYADRVTRDRHVHMGGSFDACAIVELDQRDSSPHSPMSTEYQTSCMKSDHDTTHLSVRDL